MGSWVHRALARWPNVPALFGWLRLDRRGRWLIRDEIISRPQIIRTINRNYAPDEQGRWYFQNGPQRGYVALDYAPLILRACGEDDRLQDHPASQSRGSKARGWIRKARCCWRPNTAPGCYWTRTCRGPCSACLQTARRLTTSIWPMR